ncbi:MAG TPA: mechanosensitive ion channel family protein [Pyrinomonadaceae bacterium]|jgi:small-conductance mechanosensitive channel/CRP-like cAMP-binding protein
MSSSRLKKQLALPLGATAVFAVLLYLVLPYFAPALLTDADVKSVAPGFYWVQLFTKIALWLALMFVGVRLAGAFLFDFVFRIRRGREAPSLIRDLFSIVAYILIVAFILKHFFDLSLGALLSGSALLGIILGLALQDTLGNLFSGISLHADKPFEVGDVITVGKWMGVVESVTWRAAKIRTFTNHVVLVSNSQIAKEAIEVCPRDNPNARLVFFNALYSHSPARVIQVVRDAIRETENVRRQPEPIVRIRNLGDFAVDYEIKYWLEDYVLHNDTDALLRLRVWYAFKRAGLSFAYPTQTLYIERPKSLAGLATDAETLTGRLAATDIFAPLNPDELSQLVCASRSHTYAPGETIIRAGEEGDSMFVVHHGNVAVQIHDNGQPRTVATLGEGDFFGEMALFTGEPRSAHVVAAEETEVLEIGHEAMKSVFDSNPHLAETLGQTIAHRRAGLAASAEIEDEEKVSAGVIASIKRFFRLD